MIRVNAKSVTVATAYSWTDRLPYDKIPTPRAEDAHTPSAQVSNPHPAAATPSRPPVPTRREDAMTAESLFAECIIPGCKQPVTDQLTPCQTCRAIFGPMLHEADRPPSYPPPTSQNETQAPPPPTA
ncbi:hypothetical protein [Rhodococcus sp. B50]|uniref:hypothetical protein n=1 Tax=Rhodococcus sp. B50 TaxID=2682847 RepID=UPI001FD4A269|nr:hypothetical protein [Rhodococcus sp. B50]MBS9371081.1 hypothetical protein [Rhodococcus sp. B50]